MSAIIIVLIIITSSAGLFVSGTYASFIEPLHLAESQGQDFTTLFFGLPLLILSFIWVRRKLLRGLIFWAGSLGYFLYIYIIYSYGGVYNVFFFGYVAICGLSLYSIIGILSGIDVKKIEKSVSVKMPEKWISIYFTASSILLTMLWGGMAISSIAATETADANVIIVTDFIVIIPAFVLSAVWLWQRIAWGYVLAGVLFVQAVTLGISIVAGQVVAYVKGLEPAWGLAIFFLVFTLIGLVSAVFYTKNLLEEPIKETRKLQ